MLRLIDAGFRWLFIGPVRSWIVRRSFNAVLAKHADRSPRIVKVRHYGATFIDPRHLVIWYLVETTAELQEARLSGLDLALADDTRIELRQRGYPSEAITQVSVGMESNENVERGGGSHRYFQ